jgi:predicted pyridoxine 5'-phosphate oxidase superfamily flavin-nucleotide-binding protein
MPARAANSGVMATSEQSDIPPFHEGELALQERALVREKVARFGLRGIRPYMPDEHREFLEQLPFVFVASLDASGHPWASMTWGLPGFVESPSPTALHVGGRFAPRDPATRNLLPGAPVGLLGLELETRRRNRVNGVVVARDGDAFSLDVTQSFGNCQKYIHVREARFRQNPLLPLAATSATEGARLSAEARRIVSTADTFFIASRSARPTTVERGQGVDVSHRGGLPGFVTLDEDGAADRVTFPDYVGNFLFNTLGNVAVDPRVGLLFVDFARGSLLSLTATASIVWEGPEVRALDGAQRLVRATLLGGVRVDDVLPFAWSEPVFAPQFASAGMAPPR